MAGGGRSFTPVLLLLGVLAAGTGGVAAFTGPHAGASDHKGETAADKKKKARSSEKAAEGDRAPATAARKKDLYSTLERFAGISAPDDTRAADKGDGQPHAEDKTEEGRRRVKAALDRLREVGYSSPHVLLATVPDPQDSRFVKVFDDLVAAIRMALERSGFVDDRFSDPWDPDAPPGATGRPLRHEQPGVLLFRHADPKDLYVVLLIGETPTRGIHRAALKSALDLAAAILAGGQPDGQPPTKGTAKGATPAAAPAAAPVKVPTLSLLGPTMSGTTESLRMTLLAWFKKRREAAPDAAAPPPFDLEIISGAATGDGNQRVLGKELTAQIRGDSGGNWTRFSSAYQATMNPDSARQEMVIQYLTEQLGICHIGVLAESSTSYGADFARSIVSWRGRKQCEGLGVRLISLPFPLHVSKLRSEHDRDVAATAAPGPGAHRQVSLLERAREDDAEVEEDAFPARSRLTQPVSEIALEQTLRAISTEDVGAVVVVASSTADTLYLVERVRQSFPNVTVVLNDADLIYLHEDLPFMDGTLIASTYPLIPWLQRLSFPFEGDRMRLLFPSSAAEGTYNAALMLLDDLSETNLVDYSRPFVVPSGGDFGPALWMTVVSRGSFWPLTSVAAQGGGYLQLAEPVDDQLTQSLPEARRSIWTLPRNFAFELANFVLGFLDLLLAFGYIAGRTDKSGGGDRTAMSLKGLFLRPKYFPHLRTQRFEVVMLLVTATLISAGFLAADLVSILPRVGVLRPVWVIGTLVFGLLTFLVLVLAFHALLSDKPKMTATRAVGVSLGGALVVFGAAAFLGWPRLSALTEAGARGGERIEGLMFLQERARNLDSGVSLLWMGLLLAIGHALWIVGHLRQVRIAEDAAKLREHGVIPPLHRPSPDKLTLLDKLGLADPMREVVAEAEGVWPYSPLVIALMVAVIADALWISRNLVFFERAAFGWFCAVAYGLLLGLIVYGCGRYIRTWRRLEEVLARVAPLPVTAALARIPTDVLTSFKRPWDRYVFEVWQRHCHRVFAQLPKEDEAFERLAARLGVDKNDLKNLLASPVDAQIDRAETATAAAVPPADPAATAAGAAATTAGVAQAAAAAPFAHPKHGRREPSADQLWTRTWEEFSAMRLVAFVQYVRAHLANFIAVSTAALLPALWATNFYPLRENRFLLMLVLAVTIAAVSVPAVVFVQMNRNYVLSKMDDTHPGQVTWDSSFVSSLLVHVALPLLALLAVKFPELGRGWGLLISALSATSGGGS